MQVFSSDLCYHERILEKLSLGTNSTEPVWFHVDFLKYNTIEFYLHQVYFLHREIHSEPAAPFNKEEIPCRYVKAQGWQDKQGGEK